MGARRIDGILLTIGCIAAVVSTLRSLGTGIVPLNAALLAGGALCAVVPLARLFAGEERDRGRRRTVLAVVFAAHLVATFFFFPPEDAVNGRPVLTLDHALHYYQAERAREIFGDRLTCYAYDPYFMAGYPGGTVFDVDSKGVELWCALIRPLGTARAYKLFILLGHLLLPFTVYAGSRRMGFRFEESLFGVLVLLAWWHWGRPYAGDFRFAGMFSYLIVIHMSFYVTGLFRSLLRGESARMFYIAGPLAFLVHPTAAVILPVPFLALFLAERRRIRRGASKRRREMRLLGRLVIWCLLVIAVNAAWIVQLWRYLDIKVPSETFFQVAGPAEMGSLLFKWGNLPAIGMMALAAWGLVSVVRERRPAVAAAPISGATFLILISTFGVYLPLIDQMEPGRFIVPAFVFMAPLAGAGCLSLMRWASPRMRIPQDRKFLRTGGAIALLLCIPVFGMLSARAFYRHTLSTTFTPEVKEMLYVLDNNIDASGRLMIEDGPAWNYGDSFLVSNIPLHTGVEQIGGPYPFAFLRHNFSNFSYCRAFNKSLAEIDADHLMRYVALYNIHWILTATRECRDTIEDKGIATLIWSSRHFALWEVMERSTFADLPGVSVDASYGSLRITFEPGFALPPGRHVMLKYHWDRGMSVEPPARISPCPMLDDPVPFISLEPGGASEILITVR